MKKIIYQLLLICFYVTTFSQSGRVTYSVRVEEKSANGASANIIDNIKKGIDYANKITFEMLFNKNLSSYKKNSFMNENEIDKTSKIIGEGIVQTESIYYDHTNKIELHLSSDNIIIEDKYMMKDWEITKESKKIDNYVCFKAIYKYNFVTRKGENKTSEVIAWFAPSLPYCFGPKNYYGLPGLILELTENSTTYFATKIELLTKNIPVVLPKGKVISRAEYNNKLKAQMGM